MLISGGLFLIAALSILGVVLLMSAEVKVQKAAANVAAKPSTSISLAEENAAAALKRESKDLQPVQPLLLESGQINSLADQIRLLHRQSQELEARLASITALTEQLSEARPL